MKVRMVIEHPVVGRFELIEHSQSTPIHRLFAMPGGLETKSVQQVENWCWAVGARCRMDKGPVSSRKVLEQGWGLV